MLSYHNDPAVKDLYVARFEEHRKADEVIQDFGFEDGTGGFVGCTFEDYDHDKFPREIGWPIWLGHLAEAIFEELSKKDAPRFGADLLMAVPVGVDLEQAKNLFLISLQRRNLKRLEGNNEDYAVEVRTAIEGVINALSGDGDLVKACSAADSANTVGYLAYLAAYSEARAGAAYLAARSAAYSATNSEVYSGTNSATNRAACNAAASAACLTRSAYSAEYKAQRDDLLSIVRKLK